MTIQNAIELAIKGGWKNYFAEEILEDILQYGLPEYKYYIFLDPLFWQALGKSIGKENIAVNCYLCGCSTLPCATFQWWKAQMHLFIDHLASGKSIDQFFNQLELPKK